MIRVTIELDETTATILRGNLLEHAEQCYGCAASVNATLDEVKLWAMEAAADKFVIDQITEQIGPIPEVIG